MKVLGDGQVRNELVVTADAFTASARGLIEEAGGEAALSERAEGAEAAGDAAEVGADEDAEAEDLSEDESDGT